jgi:hypothetical protein
VDSGISLGWKLAAMVTNGESLEKTPVVERSLNKRF